MNLGLIVGNAVREVVERQLEETERQRSAARIGRALGQRTRAVIEVLEPIRYEVWRTANDERTCPICGQLHGVVWREGAGFEPPLHDHCRCQRLYHHTEFRHRSP